MSDGCGSVRADNLGVGDALEEEEMFERAEEDYRLELEKQEVLPKPNPARDFTGNDGD